MPRELQLTTTSYAILGLLAVRPWSTYALAGQMRRSLREVWPRAESNVYAEPKRLVAAGLATAATETVGKRPRTVYTITPAGERRLAEWLSAPESARSRFESELLVKVLFGNHGDKDALLANLHRFRAETDELRAYWKGLIDEYVGGPKPFPERVHVNALVMRFGWSQVEARARWVAWAIEHVESWEGASEPTTREATLDALRGIADS